MMGLLLIIKQIMKGRVNLMIKMVDTAVPMNEEGYPVARAKHIWLDDDTNLQKAIDDGSLGGGDNSVTLTEQEYQALTDEEKYNGLYYCYDVGKIYKNGVEYARSPIVTVTETEDGYNVDIEDVSGVQSFEIPNGKNAVQFTPSITENGELAWENDGELENPPTTPIQQVYANTPIGTVLSFAGQTAPNGYLLADGASYPTAEYPDLYAVIGNTYGGDTENFNVPNLIDKFIQGSNTSGTEKEAGLPNIEGKTYNMISGSSYEEGALSNPESVNTINIGGSSTTKYRWLYLDASKSNPIYGNSDTVQPPALTMVYIIKAFHTNEGTDAPVELTDNVINHIDNQIDSKVTEQVAEVVSHLIVGTEYPTTETCPVGCWYGMYSE